jgi:hypothetical protein
MSNDVGRYRKIYPRLWRHPGFNTLSKSARELTLYLLSGPQTNRLGLFYLSVGTAAEDLGVSVETLRKGLADVAVTFGWVFDARARVFYIPSWWRWNPPENINVIRGSLKDLNEIPPCSLVEAFALNTDTLPDTKDKEGRTLRGTFIECLAQRLPQRPGNQYQEQEHLSGTGTGTPRVARRRLRTGEGPNGKPTSTALKIAREALEGMPRGSIEGLTDAFHSIRNGQYSAEKFTDAEIRDAIHYALSEGRSGPQLVAGAR